MSIDFCIYNIRGLNNKQSFVKDFLSFHKLSLCSLVETHVNRNSANFVSRYINPKFHWVFNYEHHQNGRIWVGWDPVVWKVVVLSSSVQQITCTLQHCTNLDSIVISFIYGFNTTSERRHLWQELLSV